MVEIDYYDAPKVIAIHGDLLRHLNTKASDEVWVDRAQRLVARLLNAMGQNVGYSMEQLDILEGGYLPQGLADEHAEQQFLRKSLLNVLNGFQPLPVSIQTLSQSAKSDVSPSAPLQVGKLHDVPPP
jgi:hypothetical protein